MKGDITTTLPLPPEETADPITDQGDISHPDLGDDSYRSDEDAVSDNVQQDVDYQEEVYDEGLVGNLRRSTRGKKRGREDSINQVVTRSGKKRKKAATAETISNGSQRFPPPASGSTSKAQPSAPGLAGLPSSHLRLSVTTSPEVIRPTASQTRRQSLRSPSKPQSKPSNKKRSLSPLYVDDNEDDDSSDDIVFVSASRAFPTLPPHALEVLGPIGITTMQPLKDRGILEKELTSLVAYMKERLEESQGLQWETDPVQEYIESRESAGFIQSTRSRTDEPPRIADKMQRAFRKEAAGYYWDRMTAQGRAAKTDRQHW